MLESSYSQLIYCVCLSTDLLYLRVRSVSYCISFENRSSDHITSCNLSQRDNRSGSELYALVSLIIDL